jgi:hypothetical protein
MTGRPKGVFFTKQKNDRPLDLSPTREQATFYADKQARWDDAVPFMRLTMTLWRFQAVLRRADGPRR